MVAPTQGRAVLPTDGKRRALLVNPIRLGPTKKSDRPLRSRIFCAAIIFVFALFAALVILMDLDGDATAELFSPGPLCNKHEKAVHPDTGRAIKCYDCHEPGTPIREDAEGGSQRPESKWGRKTDENCRKCHKVVPLDRAVPNLKSIGHHTDNEKPEMVRACAACHREHQGADADLKAVAVNFCTDCHNDLSKYALDSTKAAKVSKISSFDSGHPEFPALVDPGQIKFTHLRHTTAGLVKPKDGDDAKKYWSKMTKEDRLTIGGPENPGANELVALACSTCHEPDKNSDGSLGRNMRPPNFDQHCKACHRLGIEAYDEEIEHGISSSQIASKLESLTRSTVPKALPQSLDPSKIESLTANRPRLPRPVELQWPRAEIVVESNPQERLRQAMVALRRNCHQCHGFVELPSRQNPLPDVLPANIKSQKENDPWMPGARFDHRTHDTFGMKCTECHFLGDKPGDDLTVLLSERSKDVLIPKRQVCLTCHTEDAKDTAEARSRGGTSCLLCHNYHRLN